MKSSTRACLSLEPTSLAIFIVPVARTQVWLTGTQMANRDGLERQVSKGRAAEAICSNAIVCRGPGSVDLPYARLSTLTTLTTLRPIIAPSERRGNTRTLESSGVSVTLPPQTPVTTLTTLTRSVYQEDSWQRSVIGYLSQGQGDSNRVGTDGSQAKHQLMTCRLPKGSFLIKDTDSAIQRNTYRSARTSELP